MSSPSPSPMTVDRWQQVTRLFEAACAVPAAERAAWLAMQTGDDALRQEVLSLLAAHEDNDEFLESPALEGHAEQVVDLIDNPIPGQRLGPYRIIRLLGEGGMATVFLGARDDDEYQQAVAIKLVKRGMDTGLIISRFRQERQILAGLDHPHIARLIDGGTAPDGRPYLVMEHVEGERIDLHCDERRLTTVERIELFLKVCDAVQHAHQRLVVHRDLKPSNILVDAEGRPRLLDFGLAKVLGPGPDLNATALMGPVLTPYYAAPEQFRGEPASTSADIYTLGLLLYELLTGHRPYKLEGFGPTERERIVCEQEPALPSAVILIEETIILADGTARRATPEAVSATRDGQIERLRRHLAGDLDNILLKALQKDPRQRYGSVEQFAEDLRRSLTGRPIAARPHTVAYRVSRFVRRHRLGMAATAAMITLAVAGVAATLWQAQRAERERARAERQFRDMRRMANSILFEVHDSIKGLSGATPARELLARRALDFLDGLSRDAADDVGLKAELAAAYRRLGAVQGGLLHANRGDTRGALASYRKAVALQEQVVAADNRPGHQATLEVLYEQLAGVLSQTNDRQGAHEAYRRALAIAERLAAESPGDATRQRSLAVLHLRLRTVARQQNDADGAVRHVRRALALLEDLHGRGVRDTETRAQLGFAHKNLGAMLAMQNRLPEARRHYEQALALDEQLAAEKPLDFYAQFGVTFAYSDLGYIKGREGDIAGAEALYRKALAIRERLSAADPTNERARRGVAKTLNYLGSLALQRHEPVEAVTFFRRSLSIRETLSAGDPDNQAGRDEVAEGWRRLGEALVAAGQRPQGCTLLRRSLPPYREMESGGRLYGSDIGMPALIEKQLASCP